jgi:hypothetical protein
MLGAYAGEEQLTKHLTGGTEKTKKYRAMILCTKSLTIHRRAGVDFYICYGSFCYIPVILIRVLVPVFRDQGMRKVRWTLVPVTNVGHPTNSERYVNI